MYSDMSMRIIASSSPNRNSASVRASSVLPTPEGPRKMNEPAGRFGSLIPARERRVGLGEAGSGVGGGAVGLLLADDALEQLVLHADELLGLGLGELENGDAGPHRDDVGDLLLADLGALATLTGSPLVLELLLLVGEAALLVAQVGGLLELLGVDRGLLLAPRGLSLLLGVAGVGRLRHRLDAHA